MLEKLTSPTAYPEDAAQELLALLVESGAFGCGENQIINSTARSGAAADAMIDIHKKLTAYYKTLEQ